MAALIGILTGCNQISSQLINTVVPATATTQPTATSQPTATPKATETPRPTATLKPTATSEPIETPQPTLIPGWKLIEGDGVTIQLPESFQGGKLTGGDFDTLVKSIKLLGKDFAQIADSLKSYQSLYLLWAYDSKVGKSGFLTNVGIARIPVLSAMKLETVADQITAAFPKTLRVTSQEAVKNLSYSEAMKLTVEATLFNKSIKEAAYLLKDKNTVWMIVFATGGTEFKDRTTMFEQSIKTIAPVP